MTADWKPEYGVIVPSSAEDLKEGQWKCPGTMKEGPLLEQGQHPLIPDAPRHQYRGAPVEVPCGSRRFVLAFYHDNRQLFVRCDECGAPFAIVKVDNSVYSPPAPSITSGHYDKRGRRKR